MIQELLEADKEKLWLLSQDCIMERAELRLYMDELRELSVV